MSGPFWCANCLNMSTRPRITFDQRGWCNACQWMERKKALNWSEREAELKKLLDRYRSTSGGFDCLVPVSGGKDGSYVAYQLKNKYGMNPLTVTIRPPLDLSLGNTNLKNFIESGFSHIHITPDPEIMRLYNRYGFIEKGFPYYGWLTAILTSVIRTAVNFNIPLIFYGEDGEVEYGGSSETENISSFSIDYMKKIYLEGGHEKVMSMLNNVDDASLYFWKFPSESELKGKELFLTHLSYFEPWDSYRNYLVAKENCGLQEKDMSNSGTFTNFAQNDQLLYPLHTYLMYLKFGFGRATQDAGIEIRRGAMTRDQAILLVGLYDNQAPIEYYGDYQEYFKMGDKEFKGILEKFINRDLFDSDGEGLVKPKFDVRRK